VSFHLLDRYTVTVPDEKKLGHPHVDELSSTLSAHLSTLNLVLPAARHGLFACSPSSSSSRSARHNRADLLRRYGRFAIVAQAPTHSSRNDSLRSKRPARSSLVPRVDQNRFEPSASSALPRSEELGMSKAFHALSAMEHRQWYSLPHPVARGQSRGPH
jgi:hypothetical protein